MGFAKYLRGMLAAGYFVAAGCSSSSRDGFDSYLEKERPGYVFVMHSKDSKVPEKVYRSLKEKQIPFDDSEVLYPFVLASGLVGPKKFAEIKEPLLILFKQEEPLKREKVRKDIATLVEIYTRKGKKAKAYELHFDDGSINVKRIEGGQVR